MSLMGGHRIEPLGDVKAPGAVVWRNRVQAELAIMGLLDVVLKGANEDGSDLSDDFKAKAIITRYVADSHVQKVSSASSSKAAWEYIDSLFKVNSNAHGINLVKRMHQLQLGDMSMTDYFTAWEQLISDFKPVGVQVDEHFMCLMLLDGLPDSYRSTREVVLTQHDKLTINLLTPLFVGAEQRVSSAPSSSRVAAMSAHAPKPKPRGSLGACFWCGWSGHKEAECRNKKEGKPKWLPNGANSGRGGSGRGEGGGLGGAVVMAMASGVRDPTLDDTSVVDSGAAKHMYHREDWLHDYRLLSPNEQHTVMYGNGNNGEAVGIGNVHFDINGGDRLVITKVLHVPDAAVNLLSVGQLTDKGLSVVFNSTGATIQRNGAFIATAERLTTSLYHLNGDIIPAPVKHSAAALSSSSAGESPPPVTVAAQLPSNSVGESPPPVTVAAQLPNSSGGESPPPVKVAAHLSCSHDDVQAAKLAHCQLGHIGYRDLLRLKREGMVDGLACSTSAIKEAAQELCKVCTLGKQRRNVATTPNVWSHPPVTKPLQLVHSDVCQLPAGPHGKYFVTVLDDYSKLAVVRPLRSKDEAAAAIQQIIKQLETQSGQPVQRFRSDNGGEYISNSFEAFLADKGILHEKTAPYSPMMNGAAERLNLTLLNKTRCLLIGSGLFQSTHAKLWPYALMTAAHLRNRSPVAGRDKTPMELFSGCKPSVSHLRTFGCPAYVLRHDLKGSKLAARSKPGLFLGYAQGSKAYLVYVDGNVVTSKDVVFDERELMNSSADLAPPIEVATPGGEPLPLMEVAAPLPPPAAVQPPPPTAAVQDASSAGNEALPSGEPPPPMVTAPPSPPQVTVQGSQTQEGSEVVTQEESQTQGVGGETQGAPPASAPVLRRSSRVSQPPSHLRDFALSLSAAALSAPTAPHNAMLGQPFEPSSQQEAMASPWADEWRKAEQEELASLTAHGSYVTDVKPPDIKALDVRWVYTLKRDARGNIVRFKARLVVKGFMQRHGIDYDEVYAPTTKQATIRVVLALAAARDLALEQLDIKTAFLNGDVDREVWVKQAPGYEQGGSHVAWRLIKALYGLKQAPRAWYLKLKAEMEKLGYTAVESDACLYVRRSSSDQQQLVCVHVDDCLIAAADSEMKGIKEELKALFEVHDLGEAHFFLAMEIVRDREKRTLHLRQRRYITDLLHKYGMEEARPKDIPMAGYMQSGDEPLDLDRYPYRGVVGSLLYLAGSTRPDIATAVGMLARHMAAPTMANWQAAVMVLRYISSTRDMGLQFGGDKELKLYGYSDSDWGGDVATRRSTSGMAFVLNGAAVSWGSRLQITAAASTCEAEYQAAASATKEALWLRGLLNSLDMETGTVTILCDNQAALSLLKGGGSVSARTKHIDMAHHFVKDRVLRGEVGFVYCETAKNVADIFTKPLDVVQFQLCRQGLGVI